MHIKIHKVKGNSRLTAATEYNVTTRLYFSEDEEGGVVFMQVIKKHGGRGGTTPLPFNLDTGWDERSASRPSRFTRT